MLFGRLRILGKLTLLVLAPLFCVAALSVPVAINRSRAADTAGASADLVTLATRVGTALQELQEERLLSVGYVFGLVSLPDLVKQTSLSDDAVGQIAPDGQAMPAALRQAVGWISGLERTRSAVLAKEAPPDQVVDDFTGVITPVIDALDFARRADLTTATGRQIFALDQTLRSDDVISQAAAYLTAAVATKQPGFISLFSSKLIELQLVVGHAEPYFTDAQFRLYLQVQTAFVTRVGPDFFTKVRTDPAAAINSLDLSTLYPGLLSSIVLGGFVEKRIASDVDAATTQNHDDAIDQAYLILGVAVLLLIVVLALSLLMARAVARPLRKLTASAERIARTAEAELERVADDDIESAGPVRLDPVDIQAHDEIGDLARAFDRVQTTAARLVERQVAGRRNVAQMFGHVGRRTQNLVGRQLALIDSLERRETDADRLRELYRLDHMSSRLRRNASSLVVISGGASANDHMAPMPLSDVVRLALGEIEDYTRVDVEVPEEMAVLPAVVADLTLVLAELMENATSFSPPHTRVTVTAFDTGSQVRLSIIDHGLGLSPDRLVGENARLTSRERLDLTPSEVLGLFVVGRLARRHGFAVSLAPTRDGGVTAHVDLSPLHLLARPEALVPAAGPPIQATVPSGVAEFAAPGVGAVRAVPGGVAPFDSHVLSRATRTLETGRSWNAFAPNQQGAAAAIGPAPNGHHGPPPALVARATAAIPARPPGALPGAPTPPRPQAPAPIPIDAAPIDRAPIEAALVDTASIEAALVHTASVEAAPVEPASLEVTVDAVPTSSPVGPVAVPRQRTPDGLPGGLRRRVPGTQLPAEVGPSPAIASPTPGDASVARDLVEAFEAGVSRAHWDVIEADLATPPSAGHAPLARRVPGATLPAAPQKPSAPPAATRPMDPDEARDLIEQFEYGVALALNEVRPQHEGQPR